MLHGDFHFVGFLEFFHSVKKVSKPSISCEIIFVSKRTLIILIRMLYCAAFLAKNFVILFFLSFVCFIIGNGISLGVIFSVGIFTGSNFLGGKFLGVIFTGGNFYRGIFIGAVFIGGNFLEGNFLGAKFLGRNFLRGTFPDTIIANCIILLYMASRTYQFC